MKTIESEKILNLDKRGAVQWITECEAQFERQFVTAFDLIMDNDVRIAFIAGPSCSGKTTAAGKLGGLLRKFGIPVVNVSTDDFFLDEETAPRDEDGTPNYESFDFIDSDLMIDVIEKICAGEEYRMPFYNFKKKHREEAETPEAAPKNALVLVEGIHALNDKFFSAFQNLNLMGFYICPNEFISLDSRLLFDSDDVRFLRRLVRDKKHRNTPAADTFAIWENVLEGEDLYINPFKKNARILISSTFAYEPFMIRDQAIKLLGEIPGNSRFRFKAKSLAERLERLIQLDEALLPGDSLLNEFLK
ncbi:MAG: hypothetical protein IJV00_10525 [Clostridia bacterium]|nr:hypothetical protein [Clostridia bacterium]